MKTFTDLQALGAGSSIFFNGDDYSEAMRWGCFISVGHDRVSGYGNTPDAAMTAAMIKRAEAINDRRLKTASEMKAAILEMIPEHSEADFLRGRIAAIAVAA